MPQQAEMRAPLAEGRRVVGSTTAVRGAAPSAASPSPPSSRRHELDWLRTLAVLGLIPFHVAIVFTSGSRDYVKSAETSLVMDTATAFITYWGIPLLFLVSGAGTAFALRVRSNRQYVGERLMRLLIPFVFGMLTIVPVQVYWGYLSRPGPHVSFWQYYGNYLSMLAAMLHGQLPSRPADWAGHLWFIPPLLLYSLIALPLLRYLSGPRGANQLRRLLAAGPAWLVLALLGLPLGLSEAVLRLGTAPPLTLNQQAAEMGSSFIAFLLFFLYGFLLYADARVEAAVARVALPGLLLGLGCWLVQRALTVTQHVPPVDYSLAYMLYTLLRGYISWLLVLGILGLGMRYLRRGSRLLRYLTEATFPLYVLHMPVLTIVAFYVVQWPLGLWGKYLAIVFATLVLTLVLYELLIRHTPGVRVLFGLKRHATRGRGGAGAGQLSAPPVDHTALTPGAPPSGA
jgi:glucan biosynthesis protein C